jgi:hypothetical protein
VSDCVLYCSRLLVSDEISLTPASLPNLVVSVYCLLPRKVTRPNLSFFLSFLFAIQPSLAGNRVSPLTLVHASNERRGNRGLEPFPTVTTSKVQHPSDCDSRPYRILLFLAYPTLSPHVSTNLLCRNPYSLHTYLRVHDSLTGYEATRL